jgi:hypothetical protein
MKEKTIFNELYYLVNKHYFDYVKEEKDIYDNIKFYNLLKECCDEYEKIFEEDIANNIFVLGNIITYFNLKTILLINTPRPKNLDEFKNQFSKIKTLYKNAA